MIDWKPIDIAPKDGSPVLLWARLRAHPFEKDSYFEVIGYFHRAPGVERWKSRDTDEDLEPKCWAPIPKPPGAEGARR
jgi:hypothetical protein